MEWIETANGIVQLIITLVSLISAGVGAFFAIKAGIAKAKTQTNAQNWAMLMSIADAAMKSVEASGKSGADKKKMVIDAVKAGAAEAGIDITDFLDQLDAYIDQCIAFVNAFKK